MLLFSAGLVYECQQGIRALRDADIERKLSEDGKARWTRLVALGELKHGHTLGQVRNCLAFHLGFGREGDRQDDATKPGIRRLSEAKKELTLITAESHQHVEVRRDFGADVIMHGIRIRPPGVAPGTPNGKRPMEQEDLVAAIGEARDAHVMLATLLDQVLLDALRTAGANLEPLGPLLDSDDD